MARMDAQLSRVLDDPPPADELLMTGTLGEGGEPVGRAWATLVRPDGPEGPVDFLGNTLDLFEPFRGQGLTKSFLGALVRHVRELGVRDVHLRVYAHDAGARRTFLEHGAGIDDVHLRRDLRNGP
jgi:GNAT superfamily N-acetyltransferase